MLVGLGLLVTPFGLGEQVIEVFPPIFREGGWELFTTPGSKHYHPFWAPLIVTEVVLNIAFLAASLVLLVLFFTKSRLFPRSYIAFLVASLVFFVMDALAGQIVMPEEPLFDAVTGKDLARSFIGAIIWIPYMLVSVRVKNTFG